MRRPGGFLDIHVGTSPGVIIAATPRMPGGQITQWLEKWRSGDAQALEQLMPLVYDELRQVAKRQLRREAPAHTLSSTALVHEVYLRLVQQRQLAASDREHFYAIAGRTMRRILVDHARARMRLKRGGGRRISLEETDEPALLAPREVEEVLALEAALERLGEESERAVRVIECRIFAGLTLEETAEALRLSSKSVQRTWSAAAAWLRKEIGDGLIEP
jgi:RNA polymerase sigma factor (TIGR02999 family)